MNQLITPSSNSPKPSSKKKSSLRRRRQRRHFIIRLCVEQLLGHRRSSQLVKMIRESDSDSSGDEGKSSSGSSDKKSSPSVESFKKVTDIIPELKSWIIRGKVERISRLVAIQGNRQMFFFGVRDLSGMIRVVAFGNQAQQYFNVIKTGRFYTIQYARVVKASKTDEIYPLNHEIILANGTQIKEVDGEPDFPALPMVRRTLLKQAQDLPIGSAIDVEAIIRKDGSSKVLRGGYTKKEIDIYDESLSPGETMKLALWNEDTELTDSIDLKGSYYKISVQHATTNIYIQQISINTTKGGVIEITKVEPKSHESSVITNWKSKGGKVADDSRKRKHSDSSADHVSGNSTRNQ